MSPRFTPGLTTPPRRLAAAVALLGLCASAQAGILDVTVTVQNLAPANSISFAPLHLGFNNGTFDAFNNGQAATTPIISVAEGGAGGAWQAAFAAADPGAVRGTLGGLLQPGGSSSQTFRVDTALNAFFTFAAMAVPSNDLFIGNDSPTEYALFNAQGQLMLPVITLTADEIWDAGSETFDPLAAAFVGNNDLRTDQNGVVGFNFSQLTGFDGLATGAGYTFSSGLSADSPVYSISFAANPVPEPGSFALAALALLGVGTAARRRGAARQVAVPTLA